MIIPVWIATWEIQCCIPHVATGQEWEAPLSLEEIQLGDTDLEASGWSVMRRHDPIAFRGRATPKGVNGGPPTLVDMGMIRAGTNEDLAVGEVEGHARVWARWHGHFDQPDIETDLAQDFTVKGKVSRVSYVPGRYREAEPKLFLLVGYGHPREIGDTSASEGNDFFLVELDVDGQ